jgi:prepilin-type N-terminal cleavage/methylation domain-containing protein
MRPISRTDARRGFTLVEMSAAIVVLVLLAALVTPNVVAIERSRLRRTQDAALLRLPIEARNAARLERTRMELRIDGAALALERVAADGAEVQEVRRVELGEGLRVRRAERAGEPVDTTSWRWTVYSDGSAEAARIEFEDAGTTRTLLLPADGDARWAESADDTAGDDHWAAGELEQRV